MKIKYKISMIFFVISNFLVFYYLLINPGLFFNMFKPGFSPVTFTWSYFFSSLVIVFDIFLLLIISILSITFLGRLLNR